MELTDREKLLIIESLVEVSRAVNLTLDQKIELLQLAKKFNDPSPEIRSLENEKIDTTN